MKTERIPFVGAASFATLLVLVLTGVKQFTLNSQAWNMWSQYGHNLFGAVLSGHPHGLRYVAYYPIFTTGEILDVPVNLVFGLACILCLAIISIVYRIVASDITKNHPSSDTNYFIIILIFLSLLMNGRMILAFLGYITIIYLGIEWLKNGKWGVVGPFLLILSLVLLGVSSGTLVVGMALAAGLVAITVLRKRRLSFGEIRMAGSVGVVLVLFSAPAVIGINKNLKYFGGGSEAVVKMLDHGAGGVLIDMTIEAMPTDAGGPTPEIKADDPPPAVSGIAKSRYRELLEKASAVLQFWWLGALLAGLIAWFSGWRPLAAIRSAKPEVNVVHLAIALALIGGLFGYSVLSLSIIPIFIITMRPIREWFWRRVRKNTV